MTVVVPKAVDKVSSTLNAGISPSTLSIPLVSGGGTDFPQPYTGTCSSTGSSSTLNDTGDLASLAVGDFIRNVTDGSWAFVKTTGTNSITTTKLKGGTLNVWTSGDTWRSGEFVATLANIDANGNDTAYEEVLISNRSTDTLTVPSGGRGYNGTTAQSWAAADYVQIRCSAPYHEQIKSLLKELNEVVDTNTANEATDATAITNIRSGSDFYAVDSSASANSITASFPNITGPIAAGMRFYIKVANSNTTTTTATLTLGGSAQSAKTLKKNDGATNLGSGDLIAGQIVELEYDGTNLQMLSPVGTPTTTHYAKIVYMSAADSSNASSGSSFDTHSYTIPANDLIDGVEYIVEAGVNVSAANGTVGILTRLGSTTVGNPPGCGSSTTGSGYFRSVIRGTAAAGASVAVECDSIFSYAAGAAASSDSANVATNGTLAITLRPNASTSCTAKLTSMTVWKISTTPFQ